MSGDLRVGSSGRFQGVYHLQWEWSRFELAVPSRWFPRERRVLCELVTGAVPLPAALAGLAGRQRHDPAARFAVTVDADVIDHGNFGHRGTLRWRLLVRRWVAVERLS